MRSPAILSSFPALALALAVALALAPAAEPAAAQCELLAIRNPDGTPNDTFGASVAFSKSRVVVASRDADGSGIDSGAVYVFRRDGHRLAPEARITSPLPGVADGFGRAVDIDGDRIAVAAPFDSTGADRSGAVHVYRREGGAWVLEATLKATDGEAGDELGRSVVIRDPFVLAGAPQESEAGVQAGAAYIFRRTGTSWSEDTKLVPSGASPGDQIGWVIAADENRAALSAHLDDDAAADAGAVYLFRRDAGAWVEEQKLVASDAGASDWLGASISLEGDALLVGATNTTNPGAAYVFRYDGSAWSEEAKLQAADAGPTDGFGFAAAISGDAAVVTALNDTGTRYGAGAVYLFRHSGTAWLEEAKLTQPDAAGGDRFGWALAKKGKVGIVGSIFDSGAGGTAYVVNLDGPACRCMGGMVNAGAGPIADTLFLNGTAGGASRTVTVGEGELLVAYVLLPPGGGIGKFVVHADAGAPLKETVTLMPSGIGTACFPFLTSDGASPVAVWNNIGHEDQIGASMYFDGTPIPDPPPAPAFLFQLSQGDPVNLPIGTVLTFQGAMVDPGTAGARPGSVTNGVILVVQ